MEFGQVLVKDCIFLMKSIIGCGHVYCWIHIGRDIERRLQKSKDSSSVLRAFRDIRDEEDESEFDKVLWKIVNENNKSMCCRNGRQKRRRIIGMRIRSHTWIRKPFRSSRRHLPSGCSARMELPIRVMVSIILSHIP